MHRESLYGERALRAGASGYITKQEAAEMIIVAIREILKGKIYLSDQFVAQTVHKFIDNGYESGMDPVASLTDRELVVFRLIGRGHGTCQIADELHLSPETVKTYSVHNETPRDKPTRYLKRFKIRFLRPKGRGIRPCF